jgi:hypothetical protein
MFRDQRVIANPPTTNIAYKPLAAKPRTYILPFLIPTNRLVTQ